MVPTDQPVWGLDLITRFTSDKLLPARKWSSNKRN
jgi:hypothetical protein